MVKIRFLLLAGGIIGVLLFALKGFVYIWNSVPGPLFIPWGIEVAVTAALGIPVGILGGLVAWSLAVTQTSRAAVAGRAALGGLLGSAFAMEIVRLPTFISEPWEELSALLAMAVAFSLLIGLAAWVRSSLMSRGRKTATSGAE